MSIWRGARDPPLEINYILVVKYYKDNSDMIKHACNKTSNFIESFGVVFDINEPPKLSDVTTVYGLRVGYYALACFT